MGRGARERFPATEAEADYPTYSRFPFEIPVDASLLGLGAILYQEQDGHKRVIAYASRSVTKSERCYPAHKLEFLALKWAISDKFHDYLYGKKFICLTDNNPMTYVLTTAKLDATSQRWVAALAMYDFDILYRSGLKNMDADSMSRHPELKKHSKDMEVISEDVIKSICKSAGVFHCLMCQ